MSEALSGNYKITLTDKEVYEQLNIKNMINYYDFYEQINSKKCVLKIKEINLSIIEVIRSKMSYQDIVGRIEWIIKELETLLKEE